MPDFFGKEYAFTNPYTITIDSRAKMIIWNITEAGWYGTPTILDSDLG